MFDNAINPRDLSGQSDSGVMDQFSSPDEVESDDAEKFKGLVSGDNQTELVDPSLNDLSVDRVNNVNAISEVNQPDFGRSMAGDVEGVDEGAGDSVVESTDNVANLTIGDKILDGFQGLRDHIHKGANTVQSHMKPGMESMGIREMFQTQLAMTNLMITEDYIGKVVSKGTQAFDTLLRNQ